MDTTAEYYLVGTGLDPYGDTVRFVSGSATDCTGGAAGGTSDITNLGHLPLDTLLAPSNLIFTIPGTYQVCIKFSGQTFVLLDSSTFFVTVKGPASFSPTQLPIGVATTVTFTGAGLNRASGQDMVKVVASSANDCSSATIVESGSPLEFTGDRFSLKHFYCSNNCLPPPLILLQIGTRLEPVAAIYARFGPI